MMLKQVQLRISVISCLKATTIYISSFYTYNIWIGESQVKEFWYESKCLYSTSESVYLDLVKSIFKYHGYGMADYTD